MKPEFAHKWLFVNVGNVKPLHWRHFLVFTLILNNFNPKQYKFNTNIYFFIALKIWNFVPKNYDLMTALIFCYHMKKTAAESHRMLAKAYGEHALG